jgi:hypothetical protein
MFRKLAYAGIAVAMVGISVVVGCGDGGGSGTPDFAMKTDGGGPGQDLSVNKMYAMATPHDVDTNMIGGNFGVGTAVQMSGLIVLAPPYGFASNSKMDCKYEVYAQDPSCSTPPCAIILETQAIPNPNGTGQFCPYASDTTTPLKMIWEGDKVNVSGVVDTFPSTGMANDMSPSGTIVQHSITIDTLDQVSTKNTLPAATVVTDATPSLFVPYSGTGWAMYESMLITLKPASGKFTTTLDMYGGWTCAPGGAHFADDYTGFFRPDGAAANMYPPNGSMFSSITGIVGTTFGGGILPTSPDDFVP